MLFIGWWAGEPGCYQAMAISLSEGHAKAVTMKARILNAQLEQFPFLNCSIELVISESSDNYLIWTF